MRILVISNFYPPYSLGGQEQSCQQVVEGLKLRGHEVVVLTSTYGVNRISEEAKGVFRALYLETELSPWRQSIIFFTKTKKRDKHNLQYLHHLIDKFNPDIVFVWGMWNLSRFIPALAETKCSSRVVYRFADYWPTLPSQRQSYWLKPGRTWFSRIPKYLLGWIALQIIRLSPPPPELQFENSFCISGAVRDALLAAGIPVNDARIIYPGINSTLFNNQSRDMRKGKNSLNLLYAGRLSREKGIDTIIEALSELVNRQGVTCIKLNIAGSDIENYANNLQLLVSQERLDDYITFLGHVPNEEMPSLLLDSDVLLVPSLWIEPFGRVVLEGMASGMVVIASSKGGPIEVIEDGENGFLFSPGVATELAQKILTLIANPQLRQQIAAAGQQTVKDHFAFKDMMDQIENYLLEVARSPCPWDNAYYRRFSDNPALEPL